jgi:hypothetical protein
MKTNKRRGKKKKAWRTKAVTAPKLIEKLLIEIIVFLLRLYNIVIKR